MECLAMPMHRMTFYNPQHNARGGGGGGGGLARFTPPPPPHSITRRL